MMVCETRTFQVGPFKVLQRPRPDNPYFAVYIVTHEGQFIGKNFSQPSLSDCEWLLHHQDGRYADSSKDLPQFGFTEQAKRRRLWLAALEQAPEPK